MRKSVLPVLLLLAAGAPCGEATGADPVAVWHQTHGPSSIVVMDDAGSRATFLGRFASAPWPGTP